MKLYLRKEGVCDGRMLTHLGLDYVPHYECFEYVLKLNKKYTVVTGSFGFSFRITKIHDDRVTIKTNQSMGDTSDLGYTNMLDEQTVFDVYKDKKLRLSTQTFDASESYTIGLHDSKEDSDRHQQEDDEIMAHCFDRFKKK